MTSRSPSKRKCQYRPFNNEDASSGSPAITLSDTGLPALLMLIIHGVYIRADGHFATYQFTNTCVLDSILAAFHVCYIKFQNVRSLLESNVSLKIILAYLNAADYNNAKALWLRQLGRVPQNNEIDIFGTVKDHFPMFAKLVCAQVEYHQETPDDSPVYETTVSKFRVLGDVKALGCADNPTMILVVPKTFDTKVQKPPLCVEDGNKKIFQLQFLLLGEGTHMVMSFQFTKKIWILYDNNPAFRSFRPFNLEQDLHRYMICWAGYINTTQADERKIGIPETGGGAQPFDYGSSEQLENLEESMEDILMSFEDLACGTSDSE
ncbi:uncharacterized protein [Salminus brasiliensis]|uniref:uncharacterized protein n=1 Tax=Salminus brasiliensis TaxID=930266 RepID=UPI003B836550